MVKKIVPKKRQNNKELEEKEMFKTDEEIAMIRDEKIRQEQIQRLDDWKPKTTLGKLVKNKKITKIDEVLKQRVLEPEIIDSLVNLKSDILNIGQAKGKFGGGKRRAWRQTQKKTSEGNVATFSCMVVVGDSNGYVGIGYGRAKETLPARAKASRMAKLNLIKINRGCGSFDCTCGEPHTVPFIVEGRCGSCRVKLIPAPQGTGLVIGDECKKILKLAGIKDVYSKTSGQIRSTINLSRACIDALRKTKEKEEFRGLR